MIREMLKDKVFFKTMFALALPIIIQNLIASSVNMLDILMITSLGEASLAAVGLANQVFYFYWVTIFGVSTGSAVFVAQFWGKRDVYNIRRILGLSLSIASVIGIVFTLTTLFMPNRIMRIFSNDSEVIRLGVEYLTIVVFSYIVTGLSFSYEVASRSIGNAKMPMMVSLISFITNGIFNYLLIFGKLGLPALGVRGAAYGTLIARIVELVLVLYSIYKDKGPLAASIKEMLDWNKRLIERYIRTAYPVIVNEAFWSLGTVLYSIAYAKISTEAIAAVQILTTVQNLFMTANRGIGNACTVMIGNRIGADEEDLAIKYANRFLIISILLGIILGLGLYLTNDLILLMFRNLDPQLYATSKKLLNVLALFFTLKVFNGTMIVGIFRGGGDTKFSMLLDAGAVWFVGVPLAFLGALVFKFPIYYVTMLVYMEDVVKFTIGLPRVISKKWVNNVVDDIQVRA